MILFLYVVDGYGFLYIEPSQSLWEDAYLLLVNGFDVFILLSIFVSIFISKTGLKFCWIFVWCGYQSNCTFIEYVSVPSVFLMWDSLKSIGINSSFKASYNSALNPSCTGVFLIRRFLMTTSIYFGVKGLRGFRFI